MPHSPQDLRAADMLAMILAVLGIVVLILGLLTGHHRIMLAGVALLGLGIALNLKVKQEKRELSKSKPPKS